MSYGLAEYAGGLYGGPRVEAPPADTDTALAVEISFTTDALAEPVWVDVTGDVRSWDTLRGRTRELEPFQPGRATVVLANLDRQYDSVNAAGPWFGNLKPMRRLRIRETFSGVTYPVFDGYIDGWQLDYPEFAGDATATVVATDADKVLARTDLPVSVFADAVAGDGPVAWWRLGNPATVTTGNDQVGTRHLTYVANPRGGERLVYGDETESTVFEHPEEGNGNVAEATSTMPFTAYPFTLEAVFRMAKQSDGLYRILLQFAGNVAAGSATRWVEIAVRDSVIGQPGQIHVSIADGGTGSTTVGASRVDDGAIHHVAMVVDAANFATVYLDGVDDTSFDSVTSPALPTGTVQLALGNLAANFATPGEFGLDGELQDVAVYDYALSAEQVAVHAAAAAHPWQDDLPAVRIGRVLDEAGWPAGRRAVDAGSTNLQSADVAGQTALIHLRKVADTEFGLLYVNRTGDVRFVDRDALAARTAEAGVVFGDGPGEVGYRSFVPDDGDSLIRNRATISRLNGVAKTVEDSASVQEFGRIDYTAEGLLHRSDAYSETYADWIVGEYAEARRRIRTLGLGPPAAGAEASVVPQMLGREIGDVIVVRNRPPGGGDPFEQTCVIEGITHRGAPGGARETIWSLSPEFVTALF